MTNNYDLNYLIHIDILEINTSVNVMSITHNVYIKRHFRIRCYGLELTLNGEEAIKRS